MPREAGGRVRAASGRPHEGRGRPAPAGSRARSLLPAAPRPGGPGLPGRYVFRLRAVGARNRGPGRAGVLVGAGLGAGGGREPREEDVAAPGRAEPGKAGGGAAQEEVPSGPGAAAGGSGNAGSGACSGERSRLPGSRGLWCTGRVTAEPSARAGPAAGGRGSRCPGRSPAPSALFLHPRGFLSAAESLPELWAVRSAAPFLPGPLGGGCRTGWGAWPPRGSGSWEGAAPAPGHPELGGGRGAGQASRGPLMLGPPSSIQRLGSL